MSNTSNCAQLYHRIILLVTRRRALLLAAMAIGSTGFALVERRAMRQAAEARMASLRTPDTLDATRPTGELSSHERATLVALALLVLPTTADGHESFAGAHVDARARTVPGALDAYRAAVALLDAGGEQPFVARSAQAQRARLDASLPSYAGRDRLGRWRDRLLRSDDERRFHMLVVRDLAAAFYRSPAGWRLAGHPRGFGEPAAHPLAYARAAESFA